LNRFIPQKGLSKSLSYKPNNVQVLFASGEWKITKISLLTEVGIPVKAKNPSMGA